MTHYFKFSNKNNEEIENEIDPLITSYRKILNSSFNSFFEIDYWTIEYDTLQTNYRVTRELGFDSDHNIVFSAETNSERDNRLWTRVDLKISDVQNFKLYDVIEDHSEFHRDWLNA